MSRLMKPEDLTPHPSRDLVPPPSDEEYESLKADIEDKGILRPITCSEDTILDGHTRWEIAKELGIEEVPVTRLAARSEDEQLEILLGLNVKRRQFTNEQKRQLARNVLKEWPEKSNRALADMTGISHPTIGSVRTDLELQGVLEKVSKDSRGGARPGSGRPAKKKGHKDGVPAGNGGKKSASKKKGKAATKPKPAPSDASEDREVEDAAEDPEVEEVEGDDGITPKDLECPHCGSEPGSPCKRPSGHEVFGGGFHKPRVEAWRAEVEFDAEPGEDAPSLSDETGDLFEGQADEDQQDDEPPAPEKKRSSLPADNPEVVGLIEKRLAGRSEPTVKELYDAAKRINPALGDLTVRQFNARYVLQIKRGALGSGGDEGEPTERQVRGALLRWAEQVPAAPDIPTKDTTELLATEPFSEELCDRLMGVSRFIQKVVGVSRSVHSGDPAPEEDEAPEPAGMPV